MRPRFSLAVDPILLDVLNLLDQISANEPVSAEEARDRIQNRFRETDARLTTDHERDGWELAKYALVAWIDDVLIDAPWAGSTWWENNSLEFAFFNTRERATSFFKKADEAALLTRRDALEVFYVCVILGFRGLYALQDATFLAEQLELPPDAPSWQKRVARLIEYGQGRPPIDGIPRPGAGAPPLEGKFQLLSTGMITVALALTAVVLGYYVFLL